MSTPPPPQPSPLPPLPTLTPTNNDNFISWLQSSSGPVIESCLEQFQALLSQMDRTVPLAEVMSRLLQETRVVVTRIPLGHDAVQGCARRSRPPKKRREPPAKRRRSSSSGSPTRCRSRHSPTSRHSRHSPTVRGSPTRRRPSPTRRRNTSRPGRQHVETSKPRRTSRSFFKKCEELFGCETPSPEPPLPPREQPEPTREHLELPREVPESPHEQPDPNPELLEPPRGELKPPQEHPEPTREHLVLPREVPESPHEQLDPTLKLPEHPRGELKPPQLHPDPTPELPEPPREELELPHELPQPPSNQPEPPCKKPDPDSLIPVKMEHRIPLRNRIKFEDTSSDEDDIIFVGMETASVQVTGKDTRDVIESLKPCVNKDNNCKQRNNPNYVKPCPKSRKPGANNNVIIIGTKRKESLENSVVSTLPKKNMREKEISKFHQSSDNVTSKCCFDKTPNHENKNKPDLQNSSIVAAFALGAHGKNNRNKKNLQKRHFKVSNYTKKDLIKRKRQENRISKASKNRLYAKQWKVKSKGQTKLSFVCKEKKNSLHTGKQTEPSENQNGCENELSAIASKSQDDIAFKIVAETERIVPAIGKNNQTNLKHVDELKPTSFENASTKSKDLSEFSAVATNYDKILEEIQAKEHDKKDSQRNTGSKIEFNRGDINMAVSKNSLINQNKSLTSLPTNEEIILHTQREIKMEHAIDDKTNKLEEENTSTIPKLNEDLIDTCNRSNIKVKEMTVQQPTLEKCAPINAKTSTNNVKEYSKILLKPIESLQTQFISAFDESRNERTNGFSNESVTSKIDDLQENNHMSEIPCVNQQPVDPSYVTSQRGLDLSLTNDIDKLYHDIALSTNEIAPDIKELAQNIVLFMAEIKVWKKKMVEAEKFKNQADILKSTAMNQFQEYTKIFVHASNKFFLNSHINWFEDHSLFEKLLNAAKVFANEYKLLEKIDLDVYTRLVMDMFARNQNNIGKHEKSNTNISPGSQAMQVNLQNNANLNLNIDSLNQRNGENSCGFTASQPPPPSIDEGRPNKVQYNQRTGVQKNSNYFADNWTHIPGAQTSGDEALFSRAGPVLSHENPLPQGLTEGTDLDISVAEVIQNKQSQLQQMLQQSVPGNDLNLLNLRTGYQLKCPPSYDTHTPVHNLKVSGKTDTFESLYPWLQRPNEHQNINGNRPQCPQMRGVYPDTQHPHPSMTSNPQFASSYVGLNQTQFRETISNSSGSSTHQNSVPPPYRTVANKQYSTYQPNTQNSNLHLMNALTNTYPPYSVNQAYIGTNKHNQQHRSHEQPKYNHRPIEQQLRNNQQPFVGTNNSNQQRRPIEEQLRNNQQPYVGTNNSNQQHGTIEQQLKHNQQPYVVSNKTYQQRRPNGLLGNNQQHYMVTNKPNQQHRPLEELRNNQSSYFAPECYQQQDLINTNNEQLYYCNTTNGACQVALTSTVPVPRFSGDSVPTHSSVPTAAQHDQLRSLSRDSGIMSPTIPATSLPFEPVISSVTSLNPNNDKNYDKHLKGPCKMCKAQTVLKCTNCYTSYYCSYRCQKIDWDLGHQYICKFNAKT